MTSGAKRRAAAAVCGVLTLISGGGTAWASTTHTGGGPKSGSQASSPAGIDVSYPQCSDSLPSTAAFAVVGVNGGLANNYNSCLDQQFAFATTLTATTTQPVAQTYLNTADPGNGVDDWPSPDHPGAYAGTETPVGTCDYDFGSSGAGGNSPACAYIYGYDMVEGIATPSQVVPGDADAFTDATGGSLADQPVWLDVETGNSWLAGANGLPMNTAVLQGMVDALHTLGTTSIGIYSTADQWQQVTGTTATTAASGLSGLPVWYPGYSSQSAATKACSTATSFTGGPVALTQWFGHPYDGDVSCSH